MITLQMSSYRQRFQLLQPDIDRTELCDKLVELFQQHEQLEIERIDSMVAYVGEGTCLTHRLLAYFGEPIEPCGHCGVCKGNAPAVLPKRKAEPIDDGILAQIAELAGQYPKALSQPRQQARFLCGLNSPAVSAQRALRGNPLFSSCAHIPFKNLFEQLG